MELSGVSAASSAVTQTNGSANSTKMLKNTLDMAEDTFGALLDGLEASITGVGQNIDIRI